MAQGAYLELPYPEAGVVEKGSLEEQVASVAAELPERPVIIGGCCCAHVGAVRGLADRGGRLSVVWLDAHGDLNTPETSPSGNLWGMPLRMLLDEGVVRPEDVALVGTRSLDPGEVEYLEETGIDDSLERALEGVSAAYVALDLDVLDPSRAAVFMPEPEGPSVDDLDVLLRSVAANVPIAGVGVTGHLLDDRNVPVVRQLLAAVGL
ncbi:MAG: arginase family protein [Gaiellaceae bacterium]